MRGRVHVRGPARPAEQTRPLTWPVLTTVVRPVLARAVVVLLAAAALAGCGGVGHDGLAVTGPPSAQAAPEASAPPDSPRSGLRAPRPARPARAPEVLDASRGYVITPLGTRISIHESPRGAVTDTMPALRPSGAPLTFLLDGDDGDGWYRVLLPVRPNGATGWVQASAVTVVRAPYRLQMSTARNELRLFEGDELVRTMPAASGTGETPTPLGRFYLTELLEPTNPGFGPYAYGTSGFSEVLTSYGGGPGQVGLHGTDDPDSVGRSASHGCIRLSDEDITYLAEHLPLGTPVDIV